MTTPDPAATDSGNPSPSSKTSARRGIAGVLLAVWLGITVARLLHAEPLTSANDRSRWSTVRALVEERTYQIDNVRKRPGWDTIDLVKHEGHFYSTKPPLFPTLVAGVYWLERETLGWTLADDVNGTTRVLLLVVNVLPMLLALSLFGGLLQRVAQATFTFAFVLATACLGTLLCPFTNVLNNHTPAAVSVIFTLCAAAPLLAEGRRSGWRFLMAGFWAACACCVELPAAAFGLVMFLLLFFADKKRTLFLFVPAALIPLGAFFYTNYLATGGWKPFYLYYGTEKYEFIHNGIPSYWMNPKGLDQAIDAPRTYFMHCTVGHHGVLSLSPVFLLTVFSWLLVKPWWNSALRSVHGLGLLLTVVVFGFFMTRTENYNYGGVSVALRWLLWLVPFWLLALVPFLDAWQPGRISRGFCLLLLAGSTFSAWYPLDGPWKQPWLFNVLTDHEVIDYSDREAPRPEPFHSWIRQLPSTGTIEADDEYWIELEGLNARGQLATLRIADAGGIDVDGRTGRQITFTETVDGEEPSSQTITVNVEEFTANQPVAEVLLWPAGEPSAQQRQTEIELLRGLPQARPYAPGKIRYLGSPLRDVAFQTRHAASRVLGTPKDHPRPTIYRRDVWVTEDVPFGILEFRVTIQDYESGEVVHQSTMRATVAGRVRPFDPNRLELD